MKHLQGYRMGSEEINIVCYAEDIVNIHTPTIWDFALIEVLTYSYRVSKASSLLQGPNRHNASKPRLILFLINDIFFLIFITHILDTDCRAIFHCSKKVSFWWSNDVSSLESNYIWFLVVYLPNRINNHFISHIKCFFKIIFLIYLYFPPSSQLVYLCFCPVGLSLL